MSIVRMNEQERESRLLVLEESLKIENSISELLGYLLKINRETSVTLGNKSTALPLNQKVALLLDMKIIDKNDKKLLQQFMSIRNQFMHNVYAIRFEKCVNFIDGLDNWFFKAYPKTNDKMSLEDYFKSSFFSLSEDVFKIIEKVMKALFKKTADEIKKDHVYQSHSGYIHRLNDYSKSIPGLLNEYFETAESHKNMERFIKTIRNDIAKVMNS